MRGNQGRLDELANLLAAAQSVVGALEQPKRQTGVADGGTGETAMDQKPGNSLL